MTLTALQTLGFRDAVQQRLKAQVKGLLARCQVCVESHKRDIAIFSTRRSGSTWLLELLSREPGTRYVSQPFDTLLNYHPHGSMLPTPRLGHFVCPDIETQERILRYFEKLRRRQLLVRPQWRIWDQGFSFVSDRCIYKLFYVKDLIDVLSRRFDLRIVYLIRHPIPTSLSNLKKGWPSPASAYLGSAAFKSHHLSNGELTLCKRVMREGTSLEKHVLGWCLENTVPLTLMHERDWLVLRYEDMVLNPANTAEALVGYLDLESKDTLLGGWNYPSRSASSELREAVRRCRATRVVTRWRSEIESESFRYLDQVIEALGRGSY
jgi:hypothetical protein